MLAVDRLQVAAKIQNSLDAATTTPLLVKGSLGQPILSPYIRVLNHCSGLIVQLGSELGFSPSARSRLGQPETPGEPADSEAWAMLRRFPVVDGGKGQGKA